jgi:hypothetical protein
MGDDRMYEFLYADVANRYCGEDMNEYDTKQIRSLKLLALMCRFDGYMVNADARQVRHIKKMIAFFAVFKDVPAPVEFFLLKIKDAQSNNQAHFQETWDFLRNKGFYHEAETLQEKFRIPDHEFNASRLALLKSAFGYSNTSLEEEYHRILQEKLDETKENRKNLMQALVDCESVISSYERDLNDLKRRRVSFFR